MAIYRKTHLFHAQALPGPKSFHMELELGRPMAEASRKQFLEFSQDNLIKNFFVLIKHSIKGEFFFRLFERFFPHHVSQLSIFGKLKYCIFKLVYISRFINNSRYSIFNPFRNSTHV